VAADDHLRDVLGEIVAEHRSSTAGHLSVRHAGRSVDVAVGTTSDGVAAAVDDLFPTYCATKPLLPLLLAASAPHLLDAGVDVLAAPVTDGGAPGGRHPASVSVASMLTHEAGLAAPTAISWRLFGLDLTDEEVIGSILLADRPVYSDFVAWALIEMIFSKESGRSSAEAIHHDLLVPLGLADELHVSASTLDPLRPVTVPVASEREGTIPMLSEALPSELDLLRPAFGAVASTRALADLMGAVLRVVDGESVDGLPPPWSVARLLELRGGAVDDPVVGRRLCFAGGFMANHAAGSLGGLSSAAIGHLTGLFPSGMAADPEADLAVAFRLNGTIQTSEELVGLQTRALSAAAEAVGSW